MPPKQKKQKTGGNALDNLRATGTVVVADTGDFEMIEKYSPQDATTNPTLILAASKKKEYKHLLDDAVKYGKKKGSSPEEQVDIAMDRLLVLFGTSILKIIPGRVSAEVDARLSFDKEKIIEKALHISQIYDEEGISKDRYYVKIGATWEGIQAAKELEEKHGVHCNLTLLFSFVQAVACAEAGISLVSPFIGRILDYYKEKTGKNYSGEDDPGVLAVKKIFYYYKKYGYETIIMGASFRNVDEIKAVAGVDYVTLSLKLLDELSKSEDEIPKQLDAKMADEEGEEEVSYIDDEAKFRYDFNKDEAAVNKVSDGIRKFADDAIALQELLEEKML